MTRVHVPDSVQAAAELLASARSRAESAAVVGGGTIVMPQLRRNELRPDHLVDLWGAGLNHVQLLPGVLRIGACVTYQQLLDDPVIRREAPLLSLMCHGITGGVQLRSQGTLGGSACSARPFSDSPSAIAALGAVMRVRDASGTRHVDAAEFFLGAGISALREDEVLEAIDVPLRGGAHMAGHRKVKVAEGSWPIVTASVVRTPHRTTLAIGGVAHAPLLLTEESSDPAEAAEALVQGLSSALAALSDDETWADMLAPAWYRRRIAPVVARDVLEAIAHDRHADPQEESWR